MCTLTSALPFLIVTIAQFKRTVEEVCRSLMNSLNLLFCYSSHIRHSFTNSASCHDVERISCKFTQSWILQSVVSPPLANSASLLCHKLSVALNFLRMPISHALDQYSATRSKKSYPVADPRSLQHAYICGFPLLSRICGCPQPARAYASCAGL